jgi:hypothetical protein
MSLYLSRVDSILSLAAFPTIYNIYCRTNLLFINALKQMRTCLLFILGWFLHLAEFPQHVLYHSVIFLWYPVEFLQQISSFESKVIFFTYCTLSPSTCL